MQVFTSFFILFVFTSLSTSNAGVYLNKPDDFNPKAETVGCCLLHYQDKALLLHRQNYKAEGQPLGITWR